MSNPIITTKKVTKVIGNKVILDEVSFVIEPGTLTSLIGPNGAGKSTLVSIILGLDQAYTGSVSITDSAQIQYIPQQNARDRHQLPLSVCEYFNIATSRLYGKAHSTYDYVAALEHVEMPADSLEQNVSSLSGGEKQRVAIARALLLEPSILILDEPLAAVDYASRQGLYELIRHLQQDHKMTVLLVSHDIDSVLALSDQILCLDKKLHTQCTPAQFEKDNLTVPGMITHCC